jgi:hypothetical protein
VYARINYEDTWSDPGGGRRCTTPTEVRRTTQTTAASSDATLYAGRSGHGQRKRAGRHKRVMQDSRPCPAEGVPVHCTADANAELLPSALPPCVGSGGSLRQKVAHAEHVVHPAPLTPSTGPMAMDSSSSDSWYVSPPRRLLAVCQ